MSNYFAKSVPGLSSNELCPVSTSTFSIDELQAPYPNGIGTTNLTPDPETNRIPVSQLTAYVSALQNAGVIPSHKRTSTSRNSMPQTDMDKLIADDSKFFLAVRQEYCYYETRYRFALRRFLELSTSLDNANNDAARQMLSMSTLLNKKLNNLLEVITHITESRVSNINSNKSEINDSNRKINGRLQELKSQYSLLARDNAMIETQKEMVKYTKEKNDYIINQITVFTALNAFAIGAVFAIWRASAGT
jgi:hypothetical protein